MYITYSIQVHIIQYIYTYTIQVHNLYKDTEWNYTKYAYIIRGGRPEWRVKLTNNLHIYRNKAQWRLVSYLWDPELQLPFGILTCSSEELFLF